MYRKFGKRILDFVVALTVACIIAPFFLFLLPIVSISNGGPIFFFQYRPGRNGNLFRLFKLRTMNNCRDDSGQLLPDKYRLTKVGRIIRSLSLDELPQLLNVISGKMSLIGPRPLLPDYLPLYSVTQLRRHEVRPGITGWAQVNGRNLLTWEKKFELDVWYVDNVNLLLDLRIILLSIRSVFKKEGISSPRIVTMERFTGSKTNI